MLRFGWGDRLYARMIDWMTCDNFEKVTSSIVETFSREFLPPNEDFPWDLLMGIRQWPEREIQRKLVENGKKKREKINTNDC